MDITVAGDNALQYGWKYDLVILNRAIELRAENAEHATLCSIIHGVCYQLTYFKYIIMLYWVHAF